MTELKKDRTLPVVVALFMLSTLCVFPTTGWSRSNVFQSIIPPKFCSLDFDRDENGEHFRYKAPAKNFEEPIRIKIVTKDGKPRPEVLVWADEIAWHDAIQSGTASGRIIIDDQLEYRIESTLIEYNHKTGQIFCPRKTKILRRNPDGTSDEMTVESAILAIDGKGIRSFKADRVLEMQVVVPEGKKKGPLSFDSPNENTEEPKQEVAKDDKPTAADKAQEIVRDKNRRKISPPVE